MFYKFQRSLMKSAGKPHVDERKKKKKQENSKFKNKI